MDQPPDPRLDAIEARIDQLEAELADLRRSSSVRTSTVVFDAQPPPPSPDSLVAPTSPDPLAPPPPRAAARPAVALESETVLKWVGVGLVVLAVGFAVSTAISRGWIGPELQLVGAVALSIGLILVGFRLRATRMPWTHALCSGGIAALATTFASNLFVDQTSRDVALAAIAAVAVVGYVVARFVPSEWAGIVSLGATLVGWFVVADGEPAFTATWAFTVALAFVAVILSLDRGWFALRLLGHVTVMILILALVADADTGPRQVAVVIAVVATFVSLAVVPSVGEPVDPWHRVEIQLAMVSAPWAIGSLAEAFAIDDGVDLGFVALAVAAVTGAIALAFERRLRRAHFFSLVIGASVAVTIGLVALLDTELVFVMLALQGAALLFLGRHFGSRLRLPLNAGVLLFVAAMFAFVDGIESWRDDATLGVDLARVAVIVVLAVALWQTGHELTHRWGGAVVLGLVLVWLGSVLVHVPEGQAAVSISWAVVGIGLLVIGAVRKVPELGAAGLAVLALTVGKLLFIDMREVDTLWRAGLFLLVGLGLLRLGFLLPRLTGADGALDREQTG